MTDYYFIKKIDPSKIAKLNDSEYGILVRSVDLLNKDVRQADFPSDLLGPVFYIMRKCGSTDLSCYQGMRLFAMQFRYKKFMIDALRSYAYQTSS